MSFRQLASADDVATKIDELAARIIKDYPDGSPVFVALLRGAAPFASMLMSAITRQNSEFHPELDYMMVRTYGTGRVAHQPEVVTDLSPDTSIEDRDVIVLDDVLDKGVTADFVFTHLGPRKPRSLKLAVLCDKKDARKVAIEADYVGFDVENVWLSGMGMDNTSIAPEAYRWDQAIWANDPE